MLTPDRIMHTAPHGTYIGNTAASLDQVSVSSSLYLAEMPFVSRAIALTKLTEAAAEGLHSMAHAITNATTKITPPSAIGGTLPKWHPTTI